MSKVAVVYFSGYGHTKVIAEKIQEGICMNSITCDLFDVTELGTAVEKLNDYDGIIFGAPTYMGSVPWQFKKFMDDSSKVWFQQGWKNKLAAGFTNSHSLSGDKFNALIQLVTFAAQHSMLWMPLGISSAASDTQSDIKNLTEMNRVGSSLGLMAQSDDGSPVKTPPEGDRKTAVKFGERFAQQVLKNQSNHPVE